MENKSSLESEITSMEILIKKSGLVYSYGHSCLYEKLCEQFEDV